MYARAIRLGFVKFSLNSNINSSGNTKHLKVSKKINSNNNDKKKNSTLSIYVHPLKL